MKCCLGGIEFDNVTMKEAVAAIARMAQKSAAPRIVCTANLDHLATIRKDDDFRRVYENADFVVADGMPLVWLSRFSGVQLQERVAGSDLFWELGRASASTGMRLFFLGGQPCAAEEAADVLRVKFPGAQIVGTYCPPVGTLEDPQEDARICDMIVKAEPDVLLVGLGSPKQEKWIVAHKERLGVPVSIGVGAAFDMAAGKVRRAPVWVQRAGLEWSFRLLQEPRRLWKRYFGRDIPFLFKLIAQTIGERQRMPKEQPAESLEPQMP
jgi:N-acetylglucosaminyldiphosphoundecaprenol N-acetyl-beta-D-mannosaminyltransferase